MDKGGLTPLLLLRNIPYTGFIVYYHNLWFQCFQKFSIFKNPVAILLKI